MLHHHGNPTVFATIEVFLGFLQQTITPYIFHILRPRCRGWQDIQAGRIAVVPTHVVLIHRPRIVLERTVIPARRPVFLQGLGQLDQLGNFFAGVALVHQVHTAIVDVLVQITLLDQVVMDLLLAPHRPVVRLKLHFRAISKQINRFIDVVGPFPGISHLRTAQGQNIVHGVGGVLGHPHGFELRQVGIHFYRSLGARRQLHDHFNAIHHQFFTRPGHRTRRRNQGDGTQRISHAQPRAHAVLRTARQEGPVHISRTALHGIAGNHPFADGMLHKTFWRNDLYLP